MEEISPDELRNLGEKIATNPDSVYDLTPEQALALQKYLNPLGNVVHDKKTYANLSIINWREKDLRNITFTAIIGYIFRLMEEFSPEEEISAAVKKLNKSIESVNSEKISDELRREKTKKLNADHTEYVNLLTKTSRNIIRRFLNRHFNFNPDHHLRSAHTENKKDPERKDRAESIKNACKIAETASVIDQKLSSQPEKTYQYLRSNMLSAYQTTVEATTVVKAAISTLLDKEITPEDQQGILLKKYKQLSTISADMKKIATPLSIADTLECWKVEPPVDVFHQFNRYFVNHYEQLREVTTALYNEKIDFEYSVVFYNAFKTAEAAKEHRMQHENEFRMEVITIENSGVTMLGPFKENRGRVDFYNKNTEVMKRMMEQIEKDHTLGKDLMEKQVKKKKQQNISEAGPDDPGLKDYAKSINTIQELGAKKVLSRDEMEQLEKAQLLKEDIEVPDDAIQVDMFFPKTNDEGELELGKTKFYTQAEAPLHLQEGSQYHAKYQSKRGDSESLTEAYKTKTLIGRDGTTKEIKVPVKDNAKYVDNSIEAAQKKMNEESKGKEEL
jgi:hypothetical protein